MHIQNHFIAKAASVALIFFVAGQSNAATYKAQSSSLAGPIPYSERDEITWVDSSSPFAITTSSASALSRGASTADIGQGILRLGSATSGFSNEGLTWAIHATSSADGYFGDNFILTAPTGAGGLYDNVTLTLTAKIWVWGDQSTFGSIDKRAPADGYSATSEFYSHGQLAGPQGSQTYTVANIKYVSESSSSNSGQGVLGWQLLTIPVSFGESVAVNLTGHTSVFGGSAGYGSFSASSDFSHTMGWGGIESLTDQDGNAITGFSAMSVDGSFNYVNSALAVPEPGLMLMFATGLLTIGVVGRRRKS